MFLEQFRCVSIRWTVNGPITGLLQGKLTAKVLFCQHTGAKAKGLRFADAFLKPFSQMNNLEF